MKNLLGLILVTFFSVAIISSCGGPCEESKEEARAGIVPQGVDFEPVPGISMDKKLDEFATVRLTANIDHLTEKEKEMLPYMFKAADIMEDLFWNQALGNKEDFMSRVKGEDAKAFA